jgi:hypothetical protein
VAFQHDEFDPRAPATSGAVIFYDPHDALDLRFVEDGIRPSWPHARIVRVPHAGHPANHFLAEIGFIAPFVRATIAGTEPPPLQRRRLKARSATYRLVLGEACLRRGKPRCAEQLCREALRMKPVLLFAKRTLGEALLAQGRLDEAEPPLLEFAARYPLDSICATALKALSQRRLPAHARTDAPPAAPAQMPIVNLMRKTAARWRKRVVALADKARRSR